MHRGDRTVAEPQGHFGAAGQRAGSVRRRRPGAQQPVEFDDPLVEAGQFVGALPGGTEVTLRFGDGSVATMQVISIVEEAAAGHEAETLTAGSPLGQALAGRQPGDTVTYTTPQGESQVELLEVKYPR
ncbi:hypothetical protein A5707_11160 [Mycobacterium kyorinense]|uniref:Transcription elongation factor GreA/GreB C-terminal domain-containing protein n=1 Tax=Mycobacterium kyorinense TaxID=487514 RepID=A0A1A2ZTC1_9MYCO|nr:hypothetical protein A5707_11160 [Mycobacterium kyorinense]